MSSPSLPPSDAGESDLTMPSDVDLPPESMARTSDIELPSDSEPDVEMPSGEENLLFDMGASDIEGEVCSAQAADRPMMFQGLGHDDIAEYYSPPRITPVANSRGLQGTMSADLETGVDFLLRQTYQDSLDALTQRQVQFLMLSPPCTMFSALQALWNFKRMDPATAPHE